MFESEGAFRRSATSLGPRLRCLWPPQRRAQGRPFKRDMAAYKNRPRVFGKQNDLKRELADLEEVIRLAPENNGLETSARTSCRA